MDVLGRRSFAENKTLPPRERQALFNEFWREWHPRLRCYLRSFVSLRDEDREELAADALLRAFERADGYRPEKAFAPWFYAIARRLACDRLESLRRERTSRCDLSDPEILADTARPGPEALVLADERSAMVAGFLGSLPEAERELAYLVYGESMRLADAAALTGEKLGTVKWRLSVIRGRLKNILEAEYGKDGV